jgi:hypothetical protein
VNTGSKPEGGVVTPIRNLVVRGNHFDGAGRDGLQLKAFENVTIEGNQINDVARINETYHPDTIQTYAPGGRNLVIRGNWIHDNDAGMLFKDGLVDGLVLENNVVERQIGGYALQVFSVANARIVNNTFWSKAPVAVRAGRGTRVLNNVFDSFQLADPSIASEDHNLIAKGDRSGKHSFKATPRFRSPARSDYTPLRGSPLIGAGTRAFAPLTDRAGVLRGARPDIGAVQSTR